MIKMYDALKRHRYLWQVFTLLVIVGFNAPHALAAIPHEISIGCPGTPVPEAPSDLMRVKGDSEVWAFVIKPEPGVTIDHQVWTYRGKDGGEPEWGSFSGGDGTNGLNWASPNIADHFTINVKAKRHCAGSGEGPDDFELTWGGDVVSVIIKRDGADITEPQDNPQEVKVGEMINLSAEIQNAPGNANITYQWTVPGIIAKDWEHSVSSSRVVPVDNLTKSTLDFAWVDGGNARQVMIAATVNGVTIPFTKAMFNVMRPDYNIKVVKGADTLIYGAYDENNQVVYVLGDGVNGEISLSGVYVIMVNVPADQRKYCQFWQIVTGSTARRKLPSGWQHINMSGGPDTLDTTDPYGKLNNDINEDRMVDSPGVIFPGEATEVIGDKAFSTFLMFKPPGIESIWVPLAQVNWRWKAKAVKAGTNWAPTDIVESTSPVSANGKMTTEYPGGTNGWSKNIVNSEWVNEN